MTDRAALLARLAAVDVFHPTAVPGVPAQACMSLVGRDVDVVTLPGAGGAADERRTAWSLRLDVRRAALASHPDAAAALAAAESVPERPRTETQVALERWLRGGPDGIDPAAALRVADWLERAPWAAASVAAVRGQAAERARRDRLERLAGEHFVGRRRERALLRAVVEGTDPHGFVVVEGSGGMGKSSLLARLVLDVEGWRADGPFAVAHVDFDDPELDPRSDASLLRAVARELAPRVERLDALADELGRLDEEEEREVTGTSDVSDAARAGLDSRVHLAADQLGARIAEAVLAGRVRRVAVLVDTFERAARASPELAGRALGLLWHVLAPLPAALVVCGRGLEAAMGALGPSARPPLVVTLGELDRESSVAILQAQGADPAVAARLADDLVDRPLTLRLAARAVRGAAEVGAPERAAIQRALVDGYLHLRVLSHVGDPRLRAVLHRGIALRWLTPELLLALLGDAPAPPVADLDEAERLFEALSRAHDLFVPAPPTPLGGRAIAFRPEVRRELLPLVEHEDAAGLAALHERAAAWFDGRPEPSERAEAVYHLLALQRLADAKARWSGELAPLLDGALDELPVPSREWLRIHLALEAELEPATRRAPVADRGRVPSVPPASLAPSQRLGPRSARVGDAAAWDEDAARELESLLAARRLDAAGWLLAYWTEREAASPLHAVAARYHRLVGQVDDAEREALLALAAEVQRAPGRPVVRAEMRRVLAWAAAARPDAAEVDGRVLDALVLVNALPPAERLQGLLDLATALLPRQESPLRRRLWSLEAEIQEVFDAVPDAALRGDRALALGAAAHLRDAPRLSRALGLGAADALRDPYLAGLSMALEAFAGARGEGAPELADEAERLARTDVPLQGGAAVTLLEATAPLRWSERLRALARRPERFVKWLLRLLERAPGEEAIVEGVRELLAREARTAGSSDAGERTEALAALARLVDARLDPPGRAALAEALGGPGVLGPFEPSGPGLVSAADRAGQLGILLDWLGDRVPPAVEELATLGDRLLKAPPFRHFPLSRVLELWRALASSAPVSREGVRCLSRGLEEALVGPIPGPAALDATARPESQVTWLLRALIRMNETPRLLGGAPLEQFLAAAAELELGAESARVVQDALDDLWARRGLGVPDRELPAAPLEGRLRALPASFLAEGARAERGVLELWVSRVEGGRVVTDARGAPAGLRGNAWPLAPDLLVTSLFVVRARYPGDPAPDEDDLAAQIRAATVEGEPILRDVVAWSEPLGYAVLETNVSREPLAVRAEPFAGGPVSVLMHAAPGAKRLVLTEARATGDDDRLRVEYLADASHGWLGAPLLDERFRVLAVDWGARVREGAYLRFAWPIAAVLADLRRRFPAVAARVPRPV